MKARAAVLSSVIGFLMLVSATAAQEPGWSGQIVARGALRQQIRSTSILHRPYRPLHFYGNAVRRAYYHGSALPRI